jgi:hypothetical protein
MAQPKDAGPPTRVKVIFVIDSVHSADLRAEALRRAAATGTARPDVSAVLREILDAWRKRRGK